MAVTSITAIDSAARQFRGVFRTVVEFEAIYDPPSVGSNGTVSEEITVVGVRLGDMVLSSFAGDLSTLVTTVRVSADDTIRLTAANTTAGAIDLVATDIHIIVLRPYHKDVH